MHQGCYRWVLSLTTFYSLLFVASTPGPGVLTAKQNISASIFSKEPNFTVIFLFGDQYRKVCMSYLKSSAKRYIFNIHQVIFHTFSHLGDISA